MIEPMTPEQARRFVLRVRLLGCDRAKKTMGYELYLRPQFYHQISGCGRWEANVSYVDQIPDDAPGVWVTPWRWCRPKTLYVNRLNKLLWTAGELLARELGLTPYHEIEDPAQRMSCYTPFSQCSGARGPKQKVMLWMTCFSCYLGHLQRHQQQFYRPNKRIVK